MSINKVVALSIGTLLLVIFAFLQPLRFVNNLFYDLSFRFSGTPAADSVVVVAIDETSIGAVGAMPWPRSTLANLVEKIGQAGPRAITLDILFPFRPEQTENDSLAAVFSRTQNLVLPFKAGHISIKSGDNSSYAIPNDIFSNRFLRIVNQSDISNTTYYSATDIISADTQFTRYAKYGGFLNVSTSTSSQKLREAVHVIKIGNEYFPSLALASVAAYRNLSASDFVLDGKGAVEIGTTHIPLTSYAGTSFINFRKGGITTISASDVLSGSFDKLQLSGKLVFVGVTDPAAGADFFMTPVGPQFPGVMVWATVALDIMQKSWVSVNNTLGSLTNWLLVLLLFPGCALLIPASRRMTSVLVSSSIFILSIIICIVTFKSSHYFWDPTSFLYAWGIMILWLAVQKAVPVLAEKPILNLDPIESFDKAVLSPPQPQELEGNLPKTETADFITKSLTSLSNNEVKEVVAPHQTLSGTIVEGKLDNLQIQPKSMVLQEMTSRIRELAGGMIVRCLGSGGMADVYLVWNPRLEVYRAVKVIKPEQPANLLKRFETEIRIFSKLDHPNIVQCHSVGDWHTLPYLEMEYINGASMEEVQKKCTILTTEQALAVGILVCRALNYAHNQAITIYGQTYKGIVHRDLKPANIMLSRNGKIKLTDFGIARPGEVSLHTMDAGSVVGTLPYLAPEQIEGTSLTGQADIYALGATLYELLTGERAFPQTEIPALLNAKMAGKYKALTPSSRISKEVIAIIAKSMAVQPPERYESAVALKNDLEKVLISMVKSDGYSHIEALIHRMWS